MWFPNKRLCLSRTNATYNQSFPQVFPEIFYKYSISSFPDRHARDVHYETLRIGLRRIRNSLDVRAAYFCFCCLSLMKCCFRPVNTHRGSRSGVQHAMHTCSPYAFLCLVGICSVGATLCVCVCMPGETLSPCAQLACTLYRNISESLILYLGFNRMSIDCMFEVQNLIWQAKRRKSEAGRSCMKLQI